MQTKNLMDYNFTETHVIKARLTRSYAITKNHIEFDYLLNWTAVSMDTIYIKMCVDTFCG